MKPLDGTPPFWVDARHADEEYDSDDDYNTLWDTWPDFDQDTGDQKLELRPEDEPDRRFVLPSFHSQQVEQLTRRGFRVKRADTIISLSPNEEDTLLIWSECLAHPFFRAGLSGRWSSNRLTTPVVQDDCTIIYRYELELNDDGTTSLIGKMSSTPPDERKRKWEQAQEAFEDSHTHSTLLS